MKQELDEKLCAAYPKLFVNRYEDMTKTAMCWGFDCGNGWYNIINQLCAEIQNHIDWRNKQRESAIQYNQMVTARRAGDSTLFDELYSGLDGLYKEKRREEALAAEPRKIPDPVPQVVVDQVKEKFGTLRFYYTGGDDTIHGMVRMAEAMSGVTCEGCGVPAETNWPKAENGGIGGWVRTICRPCNSKREAEQAARLQEYKEKKNDIEYKFIDEDTGHHD